MKLAQNLPFEKNSSPPVMVWSAQFILWREKYKREKFKMFNLHSVITEKHLPYFLVITSLKPDNATIILGQKSREQNYTQFMS